ncbi:MAG: 1-aminocyclopropane-1-carboxylate deaminase/D-cysteine desulfhydrase [Methylococcaceae bacterium]|nr:1-aminocyclopropane-1-carboxylate deaminase/D-cysteine desulfhydrase [Methylococcaceae bacterium]
MHLKLTQLEQAFNSSTLTRINDGLLDQYDVELWIKRDDLLHPVISGNKWRKLKYVLDDVLSSGLSTIVSMGGAYSNHLHALAYAGHALQLNTFGFIRGEQPEVLNPTLLEMRDWGMTLKFVSRVDYRSFRNTNPSSVIPDLAPHHYWLPEGGATILALKGVSELVHEIDMSYDTLCAPCGTGTTLAGIINASAQEIAVLGFSALKNSEYLTSDVKKLLISDGANWQIIRDYHFGGFAKVNDELMAFIENFEQRTSIPLDPIYTGKMMYGLYDLIKMQYFKPGHRIIALHTGGLQGKRGFGL